MRLPWRKKKREPHVVAPEILETRARADAAIAEMRATRKGLTKEADEEDAFDEELGLKRLHNKDGEEGEP